MSKLRKYTIIFSLVLFAVTISISIYLDVKSNTLSKQAHAEFNKFMKTNSKAIGGEAHFASDEDEKRALQLLFAALDSKEQRLSRRLANSSDVGFMISIICFFAGILALTCNLLKKSALWAYNNPQKAILYFAIIFFFSSWLYTPFIFSGDIYYSFILIPRGNGSRIFWALLLIEWTVVFLPLGLIYKRLHDKAKSTQNNP